MIYRIFIILAVFCLFSGCNRPYLFYDPSYKQVSKKSKITVEEVIALSKAGVSDPIILQKMKGTILPHPLKKKELRNLEKSGVSQRIIRKLKKHPAIPVKVRKRRYSSSSSSSFYIDPPFYFSHSYYYPRHYRSYSHHYGSRYYHWSR